MKLDIQRFAGEGDGTITINTVGLDQIASLVKSSGEVLSQALTVAGNALINISNCDPQITAALGGYGEVLNGAAKTFGEALVGVGNFTSTFANDWDNIYPSALKTIQSWSDLGKSAPDSLKSAYTAEGVTKGSYTGEQYVSDMSKSLITLSDNAVSSGKEVINIMVNSGKALKSATGYSAQDIVNNAVGTTETLFKTAGMDTSVLGRIANAAGGVANGLLGFMRSIAS